VIESFALGAIGQSSLILSGLLVYLVAFPRRVVGALAGFGAGSLVGAIAFDLVPEAEELPHVESAAWLMLGAAVFVIADRLVERLSEATARGAAVGGDGAADAGGPLGIVVGAIVDGVPESAIFGIGVATGQPISVAFLFAVWISNIPQAVAPSAELAKAGWPAVRLGGMWAAVVVACGAAAALGYLAGVADPEAFGGRMSAFAAGGLLAMLTDSLIPFSFERGGVQAGVWAVIGFALALASL
jgi:ZIP family zinc transporter